MAEPHRTIKAQELAAGLTVHAVTAFSNEYAYLDSKLIAYLTERFSGATCEILRKDATQTVPIADLQPFDELKAITAVPAAAGLAPLDAAAAEELRSRGFREFSVSGDGAAAEPPAQAPAAGAAHENARRELVGQAREFLDQVGQGAEQRDRSAKLVQDLFSQGRTGKHNTKPAEQAVQEILSNGLEHAMVAIAGLRSSDQTYAHCVDTSVIFQEAYTETLRFQGQQVEPAHAQQALMSGFCHDIGKSTVPTSILDSTERFERDSEEMQLMRGHAAAGAQILSDLGLPKATINVAHYHHVKVDTSHPASYPEASWDDVLPITRLAAVVDVYQALIGKRSYKKNWAPANAVEYLSSLQGKEFDPAMFQLFVRAIGRYPVGSLLRLSTGDLAFVVAHGDDAPEQPVVAVVENAKGELMRQNSLIDLVATPDITVAEVVDHYEHYSDSDEHAFQVFSRLNVT